MKPWDVWFQFDPVSEWISCSREEKTIKWTRRDEQSSVQLKPGTAWEAACCSAGSSNQSKVVAPTQCNVHTDMKHVGMIQCDFAFLRKSSSLMSVQNKPSEIHRNQRNRSCRTSSRILMILIFPQCHSKTGTVVWTWWCSTAHRSWLYLSTAPLYFTSLHLWVLVTFMFKTIWWELIMIMWQFVLIATDSESWWFYFTTKLQMRQNLFFSFYIDHVGFTFRETSCSDQLHLQLQL